MNEINISKPNCIDCYDWSLIGLIKVLSLNIIAIIIGGILIQIIIHWVRNRKIKFKTFDALFWILILIILEFGCLYIQSIISK